MLARYKLSPSLWPCECLSLRLPDCPSKVGGLSKQLTRTSRNCVAGDKISIVIARRAVACGTPYINSVLITFIRKHLHGNTFTSFNNFSLHLLECFFHHHCTVVRYVRIASLSTMRLIKHYGIGTSLPRLLAYFRQNPCRRLGCR